MLKHIAKPHYLPFKSIKTMLGVKLELLYLKVHICDAAVSDV